MYAIQNKKNKKFVYGTDYRYYPHHQRTSNDALLTWKYAFEVESEFLCRQCGKDYQIVKVKVEVIETVIDIQREKKEEADNE